MNSKRVYVSVFFLTYTFLGLVTIPSVQASDPGQQARGENAGSSQLTEASLRSLQDELSAARDRVAELESALSAAQDTIAELKKSPNVPATGKTPAVSQSIHGQALYDIDNPRPPVKQRNVIAEKFTATTQAEANAVTRLLADDIERAGIRNITQVAAVVPGMQYGQSGNEARISIRGTRTNRTGPEADQVVGIFEDGSSVPTTTQALGPYVDIKQIEILRGPQGVMYGRNAFGGVINIISNEPDLRGWDASLEGTIAFADGTRFEGMLNMPITDTLAMRVAARSDEHSGYVNNYILEGDGDDLHDRKQQYVRWMTRWQPSVNFNLMLNLSSFDQNQTGSGIWGYQQIGAYVKGLYLPGHQFAPAGASTDHGPLVVARNFASLEDQENLNSTLTMNLDFGFASLKWLANSSTFESQQVFDSDYSSGGEPYDSDFSGWNSFRDTLSSEVRLTSNGDGRNTANGLSLDGWRPALSPEWSFGLQASYIFNMGRWGTLTPMLQTSYSSGYYANDLNLSGARQAAQNKTDLRFFWDLPGDKVRMQVYIENTNNANTLNNVVIYNPEERPEIATLLANWGNPRSYGMILSYRY